MSGMSDPFGARTALPGHPGIDFFRIARLDEAGVADTSRLPYTVRVLLEMALRDAGSIHVTEDDVRALANWPAPAPDTASVAFLPARVILQDFTGVPAVVDLAAMRSAMARAGRDPAGVDPLVPADLVIDHSVQVDAFGTRFAYARNIEREYERNGERYALLRWAQGAFESFRVVPPGMGIVHQVNLEYLGRVVQVRERGRRAARHAGRHRLAHDDDRRARHPRLGRRRHRGRGRHARRAARAADADRDRRRVPRRAAHRRHGHRPRADADRDAAQARRGRQVRRVLRRRPLGPVDPGPRDAVEHGAGVRRDRGHVPGRRRDAALPAPDRRAATPASWSRRYCRAQGLFRTDGDPTPTFTELLVLDLDDVEPSLAGPAPPAGPRRAGRRARPASATPSRASRTRCASPAARSIPADATSSTAVLEADVEIDHGAVVIAAITSCTNTSNPSVMVAAGLLAQQGGRARPRVEAVGEDEPRAGLARRHRLPGARRPDRAARRAALQPRRLRLHDLHRQLRPAARRARRGGHRARPRGRRRCSPATATSRAASTRRCARATSPRRRSWSPTRWPARIDIDLEHEPLGTGSDGEPVYLRDIWPTAGGGARPDRLLASTPRCTRRSTPASARATSAGARWPRRPAPCSRGTPTRPTSASRRSSRACSPSPTPLADVVGARVLAMLGDSVTTDHISPAGSIPPSTPAGRYLIEHGVEPRDFNSYGSRRGNHEVMMRGTFANIRLRNELVPGVEGGVTLHLPAGEQMSIFDAADALPRRGRAAGRARRQGVRLRLVARLGRQGHAAARRAGRDRRVVRAHPPLEPGRHGRAAAAVPRRRDARVARPHRARDVHDPRRRRHRPAPARDGRGDGRRRHDAHVRGAGPHRRARSRSTTCATAASCRWCCGA